MSTSPPDNSPSPEQPRYTGLQIAMTVVGVILLLPGLCSLFFMVSMASEIRTSDPIVQMVISVWVVCFFVSSIGIALIHVARKDARKAR
jgi:hypothetical protein